MKIELDLTKQDLENITLVLDMALDDFDFSGDSYPMEDSLNKLIRQLRKYKK